MVESILQPYSVSLPPLPQMLSDPSPPSITSLALPPYTLSFPLPPLMYAGMLTLAWIVMVSLPKPPWMESFFTCTVGGEKSGADGEYWEVEVETWPSPFTHMMLTTSL